MGFKIVEYALIALAFTILIGLATGDESGSQHSIHNDIFCLLVLAELTIVAVGFLVEICL
jgi:hypothetical protein